MFFVTILLFLLSRLHGAAVWRGDDALDMHVSASWPAVQARSSLHDKLPCRPRTRAAFHIARRLAFWCTVFFPAASSSSAPQLCACVPFPLVACSPTSGCGWTARS